MISTLSEYSQTPRRALALYYRALETGWRCRLKALLTHRSSRLRDLDALLACCDLDSCAYAGVQPVALDLIQGTQGGLGRQNDFDIHFHPLKETSLNRWLRIAIARLRGCELPPVDLVAAGGIYYVRDGHHRISVARSLGQAYIDAEVIRMNLDYNRFL